MCTLYWENGIIANANYQFFSQEKLVKCTYTDGHSGDFPDEWLYKNRMTPEGHKERSAAIFLRRTKPWPNPEKMRVQRCSWEKVHKKLHTFSVLKNYENSINHNCLHGSKNNDNNNKNNDNKDNNSHKRMTANSGSHMCKWNFEMIVIDSTTSVVSLIRTRNYRP